MAVQQPSGHATRTFAMNKNMLLKLHRWITLVFALPLIVVIVTGAILSVEPAVTTNPGPVAITADNLTAVLARHDPARQARSLSIRAYAGNISIGGGRGAATHVDLATSTRIDDLGALASLFSTARRLHETLVFNLRWLVTASTAAMLVLIGLGLLMGWPRLRQSLSGWHKGTAWLMLPLVVLSPLTGLLMALGITFAGTPSARGPLPTIVDAVGIIAADYDLATVSWIRARGNVLMARLNDGGEMRVFTVTSDGLVPMARNWPRLIHEGNWGGNLSVLVNAMTALALIVLMTSGLWLWARRRLRPRRVRTASAVEA
jgi:uncharacterized iron-regulated membrane protein